MFKAIKSFAFDRLSLRLVMASLIISGILSVFSTAIQIYSSFNRQKMDVEQVLDQIDQTMVPTLKHALWEFDFDQVETVLGGILTAEAVAYVELHTPTGHTWEQGSSDMEAISRSYPLTRTHASRGETSVGTLTVQLSLAAVRDRIWAEFWTILISNVAKAYLAALALLVVMHRMIIRHLLKIAAHVSDANPLEARAALKLDRKRHSKLDALDQIGMSVEGYRARVSGYISELKDEIQAREQAEKVANQAAQARTTFLGNMSHEVRNPLNSILGLFHLIKEGEDVPDRHRQQAAVGHRAAQRLLEQLVNVLDLSRLDSGSIEINPHEANIRSLANQWLETTRGLVHRLEKPIQVALELDDSLHRLYKLDAVRVGQIVNNLTANAVKFTDTGHILLKVVPTFSDKNNDPLGLQISIFDTGIGVDFANQDAIFQRFTQFDARPDTTQNGTGLGLAISRDLVSLMDGELTTHRCKQSKFVTEFRLNLSVMPCVEPLPV